MPITAADAPVSVVYVKDFYSSEPAACETSDVPFGHGDAFEFFKRAKPLDYKTMNDNYPVSPCYLMGTLNYRGASCDWKIFASATGAIDCAGQDTRYFACDTCKDMFPR